MTQISLGQRVTQAIAPARTRETHLIRRGDWRRYVCAVVGHQHVGVRYEQTGRVDLLCRSCFATWELGTVEVACQR